MKAESLAHGQSSGTSLILNLRDRPTADAPNVYYGRSGPEVLKSRPIVLLPAAIEGLCPSLSANACIQQRKSDLRNPARRRNHHLDRCMS